MTIKTVVAEFVDRISALIESQSVERTRTAVLSAFGLPPRRGPGRPPKLASAQEQAPAGKSETKNATKSATKSATKGATTTVRKKPRKKAPLQLCPVPGCKNPAAPIFGMVCAKHKGLPKATIKKYREARRAKKLGLPAPKARRRRAVKKASAPKASKRAAAMPAPASSAATEVPASASN